MLCKKNSQGNIRCTLKRNWAKALFSDDCKLRPVTRRSWLLAGVSFVSACRRKKNGGYAGYALIATSGERSVAVLDLMRFRLAKSIPLPAEPTAILASAASGRSYVLTPSTGSIHALDAGLQAAGSGRFADELTEVRLAPDDRRLIAISGQARELIEIRADFLRVNRRYQLQGEPRHLDLGAGDYAAVSTGPHGAVELFHLPSGKRWSRSLPGPVGGLRFRADGKLLLAANLSGRSLIALSVPELEIISELPLAMTPSNLCFGARDGQLFVSGPGMDGVAIVFPYQIEVQQTVLAGRDPGVMACSEEPEYLFVGSASGTDVCILNIYNRQMIGIVDVAQRPGFIATTPDSQYALVLDEQSGNIAVIHIAAIRLNWDARSKRSGASLYTLLPVGLKPVQAVVVPWTA